MMDESQRYIQVEKDYKEFDSWFWQSLATGELPWDKAIEVTLPQFLAKYSLHDSSWISLFTQPNDGIIAVIDWDTFWCKERISYYEWPETNGIILLLDFEKVYQTHIDFDRETSNFGISIYSCISEQVTLAEREVMFEELAKTRHWATRSDKYPATRDRDYPLDETLHRTLFIPNYGNTIELWHSGKVRILIITRKKEIITFPDLP